MNIAQTSTEYTSYHAHLQYPFGSWYTQLQLIILRRVLMCLLFRYSHPDKNGCGNSIEVSEMLLTNQKILP